jgi:hypothetical protein
MVTESTRKTQSHRAQHSVTTDQPRQRPCRFRYSQPSITDTLPSSLDAVDSRPPAMGSADAPVAGMRHHRESPSLRHTCHRQPWRCHNPTGVPVTNDGCMHASPFHPPAYIVPHCTGQIPLCFSRVVRWWQPASAACFLCLRADPHSPIGTKVSRQLGDWGGTLICS